MSDPILPDGIRVGAGRGEGERGVVRLDLAASDRIALAAVLEPRQARALAALLVRQADAVEAAERARGPLLGVVP